MVTPATRHAALTVDPTPIEGTLYETDSQSLAMLLVVQRATSEPRKLFSGIFRVCQGLYVYQLICKNCQQTPTDDNQDLFPPMGFRCSRREAITGTSLASQSRDFHSVPLACSVYSTACYARTNLFPGFAASVGTQLL
ncbi:hypothetical protein J6590_015971 [Homalodisca vitripennis]|nr:hypothetical protein J6590_015971 [Homalodisca vitripennis]